MNDVSRMNCVLLLPLQRLIHVLKVSYHYAQSTYKTWINNYHCYLIIIPLTFHKSQTRGNITTC